MNPYLNDDLMTLAASVRRFADARVAPGFLERDRTRVLDRGLMREMGAMGLIAPELPEQLGGQGLGCLAAGVVHEELARADLSMSYVPLLASLNAQILAAHGQPDVARPWLQKMVAGKALCAIALPPACACALSAMQKATCSTVRKPPSPPQTSAISPWCLAVPARWNRARMV